MELMAELESRLGSKVTSYLDITVSYKHSAFPTFNGFAAEPMGMSYYGTTMKTEAHVIIKRHCPQSTWAIGSGGNPIASSTSHPLIPLINTHYDSNRARDIISKITAHGQPNDMSRQQDCSNQSLDSTSKTFVQTSRNVSAESTYQGNQAKDDGLLNPIESSFLVTQKEGICIADLTATQTQPRKSPSPDPARKIWNEMRKNARGLSGSPRSGTLSSESGVAEVSDVDNEMEAIIQQEETRIMEMAVRNKRSVGADTLRSIAAPVAASAAASVAAESLVFDKGIQMKKGWRWVRREVREIL